ncbi:hypothetical protein D3C84_536640 [compost metagenome]
MLGTQKKKYYPTTYFYRGFIEIIKRRWTSKNTKITDYLAFIHVTDLLMTTVSVRNGGSPLRGRSVSDGLLV